MFKANIYTMTDIWGPRRRDGYYMYEIEVPTQKGPATRGIYPKRIRDATQNQAELTVLVEALKRLNQGCELEIYTESAHIASALEEGWLKKWHENGWKNAKGKEISNRDLWQEMAELLNGSTCRVHAGEFHSRTRWMRFELENRHKQKEDRDGK